MPRYTGVAVMKTALVTGESRGIGQATAVNLLGRGYKVHGTFNHSEAEARELERAYENLTFHQADFSDRTSTNHLIEELAGERFDAIVNNAGIFEMEDFSDLISRFGIKSLKSTSAPR